MPLTNPNNVITEERLAQFYQQILPYLGGMPDVLANKFNRADLYSTDEKLIGTWIDGKPLYQKTVVCGALPNSTSKNVAHGISNLDKVINFWGMSYNNTINQPLPVVHDTTIGMQTVINFTSTNIFIRTGVDRSNYTSSYVTIQYTKTTDSAVEIGDDTDYSTTEKIVGTWIDGKPIWQKTITQNNISDNTILDISGLSADTIVSLNGFCTDPNSNIVPIGYYYDGGNNVSYWINAAKTQLQWHMRGSNKSAYLTVQYTKTSS